MYKKKAYLIIIYIIFFIIFLIAYLAFDIKKYFSIENIHKLKEIIINFKFTFLLVILALFILFSIFVFPVWQFIFISGYFFGPMYGFFIALVGLLLGELASFLNTRYIMRSLFLKRFGSIPTIKKIEKLTSKYGSISLLIFRLSLVVPYNITNVAYGLSNISIFSYTLYSLIGSLPFTLIVTLFGYGVSKNLLKTSDIKIALFSFSAVVIFFTLVLLTRAFIKKKNDL